MMSSIVVKGPTVLQQNFAALPHCLQSQNEALLCELHLALT